ncbi:hypothetical protein PMI06_004870 [Burkholderia sp. BT03]|nr:hypothetical protein PMI06_004870 [Burkholderia sp. BT03]
MPASLQSLSQMRSRFPCAEYRFGTCVQENAAHQRKQDKSSPGHRLEAASEQLLHIPVPKSYSLLATRNAPQCFRIRRECHRVPTSACCHPFLCADEPLDHKLFPATFVSGPPRDSRVFEHSDKLKESRRPNAGHKPVIRFVRVANMLAASSSWTAMLTHRAHTWSRPFHPG